MFSRFFRPKWQHRNPAVRLAALRELGNDAPQLLEIVRRDDDVTIRHQAIRQLSDLNALFSLFCEEQDRSLRELAGKRLKRLLCGVEEGALPLPLRLDALLRFDHEELSGEVLLQAVEQELRRQLLERVQRPSLLAEVALGDEVAELRLRALERIDRPQTLERIARQARGKDKNVARLARERLEALRAEEESPRRRFEACEAIERLVEQGAVDLVAAHRLQEEWQGLSAGADAPLRERFAAAVAAFERGQEAHREEAQQLLRQRDLCERCEQQLQGLSEPGAELNGIDTAMEMLEHSWQELVAGREPNPGLAARFHDGIHQLKERVRTLRAEQQELAALQACLDEAQTLCSSEEGLSEAAIARLEERWQQCGGGRRTVQNSSLHEAFANSCGRGRSLLRQRREEASGQEQEIAALLTELEQSLREGQLQSAISLSDRAQDRLNRLKASGSPRLKGFSRRLAMARGQLHELRDWRRFGTNQAREKLLLQMAALQESALAPRALANEIKRLQQAWRDLDRKDGIAAEVLWQRFEQSAEAAYATCRDHYREQERQRQEIHEARSRFLDELEQEFADTDWEAPQWEAIDKSLRRAHQRWREFGGVGPQQWEELNGRFRDITARFEEPLGRQRERDVSRREGLIAQVTRLADETDLAKALEQTREAQNAWQPQVTAAPRVEQGLWRRFKAACDVVYARQRAQQKTQRSEEQENAARKSALCERLEQLAAGGHESWERPRGEAAAIRKEWRTIGRLSAAAHKALEQRLQRAEKAFEQAERTAQEAQQRAAEEQLRQRSALCEALEALLWEGADEAALTAAGKAWLALPPMEQGPLEQALQARFDRTLTALRQGGEAITALRAGAEANLHKAEELLLQMEILSGIDSPPAFAAERLAMQVELLPAAMTTRADRGELGQRLQRLWRESLQLGPLPPAVLPQLHSRMAAIGAKLG